MQRMMKRDLFHEEEEEETSRKSKASCTITEANGTITTTEEATVYVRDLDIMITVQLLEDSPAVLSLGNYAKNIGFLENGRRTVHHISQ